MSLEDKEEYIHTVPESRTTLNGKITTHMNKGPSKGEHAKSKSYYYYF